MAACTAAGCATDAGTMLIFGQTQTVGITIGGTAADQGVEFTLGYRDKNFAIVPATVRQSNGDSTQVRSVASPGFEDALSVLGQFEVSTNSKTADVGLGKFFATGTAAKTLADGFKAKLSGTTGTVTPPALNASGPTK